MAPEHSDELLGEGLTETSLILSFRGSLSRFSYSCGATKSPVESILEVHSPCKSHTLNRSVSPKPMKRKRLVQEEDIGELSCSSSRSTPKKKRATPRRYAHPEKYSHLNLINDCLSENLDVVFCGINPGQRSAETGHHFAHHSNHFWKCLHLSGLTPERIPPTEDFTLPKRFSLGLTNMVDRPTAEANELRDSELTGGIPSFFQKISSHRPRIVAYVGLHMGRLVYNYVLKHEPKLSTYSPTWRLVKCGPSPDAFKPGLQCYKIVYDTPEQSGLRGAPPETLVYALPCTSGRVQGYQIPDKVALFAEIKHKLETMKCEITPLCDIPS